MKTYEEALKTPAMAVERRQLKLAKNTERMEICQKKLFRIVRQIEQLAKERKRLLNPRTANSKGKDLDWTKDKYVGSGGGAVDSELNDDVPIF